MHTTTLEITPNMTIDKLARMVAQGFKDFEERMAAKIDGTNCRIDLLEERIHKDIADLRTDMEMYRFDTRELWRHMEAFEKKVDS